MRMRRWRSTNSRLVTAARTSTGMNSGEAFVASVVVAVDVDADRVPSLVERTPELHCPLLGLFGNDDQFPSPEQVDELEAALKAAGKTYEFHRYDGAGR